MNKAEFDCYKFNLLYRTLASVRIPKARYVIWSNDMHFVAILAKHRKLIISIFKHFSQCLKLS